DLASELQAKLDSARKLRETQGQIPAKAGRELSVNCHIAFCTFADNNYVLCIFNWLEIKSHVP
ncbi:hypothetical protein DV515_00003333, partial [Chloebia gouldiae]